MSIIYAAPGDLILRDNIRRNAAADRGLVESVRERGVLQPITAYRDPATGELVVIAGNRRTIAAVEAGINEVPVYVVDALTEADRIADQLVENEHREPLTARDHIEAVHQMALIGLSAKDIARSVALPAARVRDALAAAENERLTEAAETATLDQVAALLEFEDDPETVEDLAATLDSQPGQFAFELSRAQKQRAERLAVEARVAELTEAGVRAIPDSSDLSTWSNLSPIRIVGGLGLTNKEHLECPGRVVVVRAFIPYGETDPTVQDQECCDEWKSLHPRGNKTAPQTEEEKEALREERRRVRENNAAWVAAEPVRRAFLDELMSRSKMPEARVMIANALLIDYHQVAHHSTGHLVEEWTKKKRSWPRHPLAGHKKGSTAQIRTAEKVALAVVLDAHESALSKDSWRARDERTCRYFEWLEAQGYTLSPVEELAAGRTEEDDL